MKIDNDFLMKSLAGAAVTAVTGTGLFAAVDPMGIRSMKEHITHIEEELTREQEHRDRDVGICVDECREHLARMENERDWLRRQCDDSGTVY